MTHFTIILPPRLYVVKVVFFMQVLILKPCMRFVSHSCYMCTQPLDWIALIKAFCELRKSRFSSLCSFLQFSLTSLYPYAHMSSPKSVPSLRTTNPLPQSIKCNQPRSVNPAQCPFAVKHSNSVRRGPILRAICTAFWKFRSSLLPPSSQSVLFRYVCT